MKRIYLDWNGSAPMLEEAREAAASAMTYAGNPSSIHREGRRAKALIENSREEVASFMGCEPREVVFTSGGSEANTLAVGHLLSLRVPLAASRSMHPSLNMALERAEEEGASITWMELDNTGAVDPGAIEDWETVQGLVCDIANSETGAVQPLAAIGEIARSKAIPLHFDAVQAWGRLPLESSALNATTVSLSGHKIGATKGIGALYVREGFELSYVTSWGKHERGMRGGTENLMGIAALAAACEVRGRRMAEFTANMERGSQLIRSGLGSLDFNTATNSPEDRAQALPNTVNFSVEGVQADTLVQAMDLEGVAMSAGSACRSGVVEPSKVIEAMGLEPWRALSAVRVSVGPSTTLEEITEFLVILNNVLARLVKKV